jgi:hypothetical protein
VMKGKDMAVEKRVKKICEKVEKWENRRNEVIRRWWK